MSMGNTIYTCVYSIGYRHSPQLTIPIHSQLDVAIWVSLSPQPLQPPILENTTDIHLEVGGVKVRSRAMWL
jgi:hypothetical protein